MFVFFQILLNLLPQLYFISKTLFIEFSYLWISGDEEYEERIVTEQEIKLTNLHKFTNYTVIILAFTQKGLGARSDSVYCSTLEDGKFCVFLSGNVV